MCAICQGLTRGESVLDPLDLLDADYDLFLGGRLAHHATSRWLRRADSPVTILFQLLLDLLEPAHHLGVLHLHLLKLTLQLLVLLHLGRVLIVDVAQVRDDFSMLVLHGLHLAAPLLTFLIFLLFEKLALLLDALLLKLQHLDLVINVARFHIAQLESVLDIVDTLTTSLVSLELLSGDLLLNIVVTPLVVLVDHSLLLLIVLRGDRRIFFIAAVASNILIISKLLS